MLPSFDSRGARGWRGPQNLWARRDTLCFDEKRVVRLREHTWRAFAWFARGSARGPSKTREEEPSEPRKHGFVGRKINVAFLLALVAIAGPPGGAKKAEQINDHDSRRNTEKFEIFDQKISTFKIFASMWGALRATGGSGQVFKP